MVSYTRNDKLMIHYFKESLSWVSLSWDMKLEKSCIQSLRDLVNAFLKKYKYNIDMTPNRMQLQNSSQKSNKSFKEYT